MISIVCEPRQCIFLSPTSRVGRLCLVFALTIVGLARPTMAAESEGLAIYKDRCARCHGDHGEGVPGVHDKPLWGDRSIVDLTNYIAKSMPQDAIGECVGEDARRVAEFLHESFYTEMARARTRPPRVELARLTVRQYSESVADLVGLFRGNGKWSPERGLEVQYRDRENRSPRPGLTGIDRQVDLHLDQYSPDPENLSDEYRVTWRGGLLTELSGDYEFSVESANGIRLFVNDTDKPIIDAWVRSGDAKEHVVTIKLLGGRIYPIRLEQQKAIREECHVVLSWKPPRKAKQIIPPENLSPGGFQKVLVVETPFPADDSSYGYERGTSVSRAWKDAVARSALEVAEKVSKDITRLVPGKEGDKDRATKIEDFCIRFAERAFRHPLTDEEKESQVRSQLTGEETESEKVMRFVARTLASPRFLYPNLQVDAEDDYAVAAQLATVLWDSIPDEALWRAARDGKLRKEASLRNEVKRMAKDPRAKSKLRNFFEHYLLLEKAADVSKDTELYPGFDNQLLSDMRVSLEMSLNDLLESDSADLRGLFTSTEMYVNANIARFYQLPEPSGDGFEKIELDPARHAGILTHPYLMTSFAYHRTSSPIHRGVFLARNVLGRTLRAPPVAVAPLDEGIDKQMTTRERVILQTKPEGCQTCHSMINPLGFALENFDAVGRFRESEKAKPIDASGSYWTTRGEEVQFNGPRALANFLVDNRDTSQSFVIQLFHHTVQQPIYAYGTDQVDRLVDRFIKEEFNVRRLFEEVALTSIKRPQLKTE